MGLDTSARPEWLVFDNALVSAEFWWSRYGMMLTTVRVFKRRADELEARVKELEGILAAMGPK